MEEIIKEIISTSDNLYYLVDRPFVIYIPSLVIKNEYGNSLELTDLFVRIDQFTGKFFVMRTSRTHLESLNNYIHSHSRGSDLNRYYNFCTGNSPYKRIFSRFIRSGKKIDFLLYWNCLIEMLSYESIQGIPHKRMSNFIPYVKASRINHAPEIIASKKFVSYKFKGKGLQSFYNIKGILEYDPKMICNYIDGEYYSTVSDYEPCYDEKVLDRNPLYVTNGEVTLEIQSKLLPDKEYKLSNPQSKVNPYLKKEVDEYVTAKIKRLHTIDRLKKDLSTGSRRKSFKTDKTLLC